MIEQNRLTVMLEYVTFGYHRAFFEELVLPSLVTVILLPGIRSQRFLFEINPPVSVVSVGVIAVLSLLLYWVSRKTYSLKFHQFRTVSLSVIGYIIVSVPVPVGAYALSVNLFETSGESFHSIAASLVFFTGIFATILIVRLNRGFLSQQYTEQDEFCEQLNTFFNAIERARKRHKDGRTSTESKTIGELHQEIITTGRQLVSTLEGCRISDEQTLQTDIETWLDEFESGTPLMKKQLVGCDCIIDTRIMYVQRVRDGVC